MNNVIKGRTGEESVIRYLKQRGYQVLDRNFRYHYKEVDIVAKKSDTIVFVEVKARNNLHFGSGIESITDRKRKNIISVARYYINKNKMFNFNVRFDVAGVENDELLYVEDAFRL